MLGAVICTFLLSVPLTAVEKSSPGHKTTATSVKMVRRTEVKTSFGR